MCVVGCWRWCLVFVSLCYVTQRCYETRNRFEAGLLSCDVIAQPLSIARIIDHVLSLFVVVFASLLFVVCCYLFFFFVFLYRSFLVSRRTEMPIGNKQAYRDLHGYDVIVSIARTYSRQLVSFVALSFFFFRFFLLLSLFLFILSFFCVPFSFPLIARFFLATLLLSFFFCRIKVHEDVNRQQTGLRRPPRL